MLRMTAAAARKLGLARVGSWSRAKRTRINGMTFASKMEAHVYARLVAVLEPGQRLVRQATFPLLSLPPDHLGRVLRFTPDFVIITREPVNSLTEWTYIKATWGEVRGNTLDSLTSDLTFRVVEAKGTRRSRDYELRRRAFEAVFGRVFEWDGKGRLPWGMT